MQRPRTPGAGITGALTVTLGGDDRDALPSAGTPLQQRSRGVLHLDREADNALRSATLPLTVSRFPTAFPTGLAFGAMEHTTWGSFRGPCFGSVAKASRTAPAFTPATGKPEPDGTVRRLGDNLIARTAVVLDCETSKKTGGVPPLFADAVAEIKIEGWAAVAYTSHNHTAGAPRYRIVLLLSQEIATNLPAVRR